MRFYQRVIKLIIAYLNALVVPIHNSIFYLIKVLYCLRLQSRFLLLRKQTKINDKYFEGF